MHNGHVVLANSSGSSPMPAPATNGANGSNVAGHVGEGVYEGRRILQYEDVVEDNLIDLL
jgi:hypothetical protein